MWSPTPKTVIEMSEALVRIAYSIVTWTVIMAPMIKWWAKIVFYQK